MIPREVLLASPPLIALIPQLVLPGFITPLPAPAELSGVPEVKGQTPGLSSLRVNPSLVNLSSANKIIPSSNFNKYDSNVSRNKYQRSGSTHNIQEECERLFCETMKVAFLGAGGRLTKNGSYAMSVGIRGKNMYNLCQQTKKTSSIGAYLVIWDYVSGCRFRGFFGGHGNEKSLFIFFEASVLQKDLKKGLIAIIELAETVFGLSKVVICLDRSAPENDRSTLTRSLRWVGFEPITLELWTSGIPLTSERWFFLGMEI